MISKAVQLLFFFSCLLCASRISSVANNIHYNHHPNHHHQNNNHQNNNNNNVLTASRMTSHPHTHHSNGHNQHLQLLPRNSSIHKHPHYHNFPAEEHPTTQTQFGVEATPVTPPQKVYHYQRGNPNTLHPKTPPSLIPATLVTFNLPQPYNVTIRRDFDRKGSYWHVYNPHIQHSNPTSDPEICQIYDAMHRQINITSVIERYKLWSGLIGPERIKKLTPNDTVYGLEAALEIIWKHQHPEDCSNKQFLINGDHDGGIGSEIHVVSNMIGLAMDLDRIFILNPIIHPNPRWQYEVEFCKEQKEKHGYVGMQCYYQAVSNCTVFDALGKSALDILARLNKSPYTQANLRRVVYVPALKTPQIDALYYEDAAVDEFKRYSQSHKVAYIKNIQGFGCGRYVPRALKPLVGCSPVIIQFHYYWWRAIVTTYFMRLNEETQAWIEKHRMRHYEEELHCTDSKKKKQIVSIYMRRGDKSKEMRIAEYDEYVNGIRLLKDLGYLSPSNATKKDKLLFFGTEGQRTIEDMQALVNSSRYLQDFEQMYYTNVFDREGLFSGMNEDERNVVHGKQLELKRDPREYLSALLNVYYLVQADAWVCTIGSNFCRIIDELRATIGGRASLPFVDLSIEKCLQVPCLYGGFIDMDWR